MSDDSEKNKTQPPKLDLGDWSPDYFPTSPKLIFKKVLILFLPIAILCTLLAIWTKSDSIEPNTGNNTKVIGGAENPSGKDSIEDALEENRKESDIF